MYLYKNMFNFWDIIYVNEFLINKIGRKFNIILRFFLKVLFFRGGNDMMIWFIKVVNNI